MNAWCGGAWPASRCASADPAGLRIAKTVNDVTTYTVRSPGGSVLSEYRAACGMPIWTRDVLYAGGRLLGAIKTASAEPTVALTAPTATVSESQATVTATVRLSLPAGLPTAPCAVTVSYDAIAAASGPAATRGGDYRLTAGAVAFPAGSLDGDTRTLTVTIVNDVVDEEDETFTLVLSSAIGARLSGDATQTITITDDDAPPLVGVTNAATVEGTGGSSTLTFALTLSAASEKTVTVSYLTADHSALAPGDYTATAATATFAPGVTSVTVPVFVIPDAYPEPSESLSMRLSAPVNAALGRAIGNGRIEDDDGGSAPLRDVTQDGWADLVFRHASTGAIAVWGLQGLVQVSGGLTNPPDLADLNWEIRAVGDLNGDWKPDLVWQHRLNGQLAAWFFDGTTRIGTSYLTTAAGGVTEPDLDWLIAGAADMDRDGHLDLIWQHLTTGALRVWHMSGTTQIDSVTLPAGVGAGWAIVGVADVNGDGWDDLVWRDYQVGGLAAWLMADTQILDTSWLTPDTNADLHWRIVGVRDMNGDGQPDLVWQHATQGVLAAWLMHGLTVSGTSYLTPSTLDVNWRIVGVR